LTNSASSLRTLGTLNGLATSVSAVGRAAGPALAGLVFSAGVKKGYVIAPWWFLSAVAIIAAIPVWWLVEGEGFGGEDEVSDDEEDDVIDEGIRTAAVVGGAEAQGKPSGPAPAPRSREEAQEHAYGALAPLSRTTTNASTAMLSDADDEEEPHPLSAARTRSRRTSGADRSDGEGRRQSTTRKRVTRKISIPIGMGSEGISRKYSSNLGQSFGSAAGN
jgi:hypothetical protein